MATLHTTTTTTYVQLLGRPMLATVTEVLLLIGMQHFKAASETYSWAGPASAHQCRSQPNCLSVKVQIRLKEIDLNYILLCSTFFYIYILHII